MTAKDIKYSSYDKLLQRRREILSNVTSFHDISSTFDNPGPEFETRAQYETGYQNLRQLDERARQEIQLIDRALAKLERGGFGHCEACGQSIDPKRLEAIPWTELCFGCAQRQGDLEPTPASSEDDRALHLTEDVSPAELSDEELQEVVYDKLHEDSRLETVDLQISCEDGIVHLIGTVPDETQYRILFDALQDILPLNDVVDNVRILSSNEEGLPEDIETSDPADDEMLWNPEDRE